MRVPITSPSESLRAGNRVVAGGITAIVLILFGTAVFLFLNLPDANAFNARVERLWNLVRDEAIRAQGTAVTTQAET